MQSYLNLLRDVMDNGECHDDRTGVGTRSVFGRQWRHDMREGFPLLTTKRVTLRWVFEELRRLIVSAWHAFESRLVTLPPCHTLWQMKCHPSRSMSLHLYARSIDIFLGLPYNIASYALLLKMLCKVTGYEARDLIISFGDLHLYNNHVDAAKTQLEREPKALCDVRVIESAPTIGCSALERLLAIQWFNIDVVDYDCWPKISAEVAI